MKFEDLSKEKKSDYLTMLSGWITEEFFKIPEIEIVENSFDPLLGHDFIPGAAIIEMVAPHKKATAIDPHLCLFFLSVFLIQIVYIIAGKKAVIRSNAISILVNTNNVNDLNVINLYFLKIIRLFARIIH